jgi:hypothetical protein
MDYMEIPLITREIIIPKIHLLNEDGTVDSPGFRKGVYYTDMDFRGMKYTKKLFKKKIDEHVNSPRIAVYDSGHHFKYNENNEVGWVFSPRYGWYEMTEELINEFIMHEFP